MNVLSSPHTKILFDLFSLFQKAGTNKEFTLRLKRVRLEKMHFKTTQRLMQHLDKVMDAKN